MIVITKYAKNIVRFLLNIQHTKCLLLSSHNEINLLQNAEISNSFVFIFVLIKILKIKFK